MIIIKLSIFASHKFLGHVDKFIGDGAMIVFGVIREDGYHAQHGLMCALLLRRLIEDLNAERKLRDLPTLGIRLGVHTGEVLVGTLGTDERAQYTVVGDVVNVTSRLCNSATPGQILVGEASVKEPGVEVLLSFSAPNYVDIKGRHGQMAVYYLLEVQPSAEALIRGYAQGWRYEEHGVGSRDTW